MRINVAYRQEEWLIAVLGGLEESLALISNASYVSGFALPSDIPRIYFRWSDMDFANNAS